MENQLLMEELKEIQYKELVLCLMCQGYKELASKLIWNKTVEIAQSQVLSENLEFEVNMGLTNFYVQLIKVGIYPYTLQ